MKPFHDRKIQKTLTIGMKKRQICNFDRFPKKQNNFKDRDLRLAIKKEVAKRPNKAEGDG
jgi:hypothetical protein